MGSFDGRALVPSALVVFVLCILIHFIIEEKAPWEVEYTIIPIGIAFLVMIGKFVYTSTVRRLRF